MRLEAERAFPGMHPEAERAFTLVVNQHPWVGGPVLYILPDSAFR